MRAVICDDVRGLLSSGMRWASTCVLELEGDAALSTALGNSQGERAYHVNVSITHHYAYTSDGTLRSASVGV